MGGGGGGEPPFCGLLSVAYKFIAQVACFNSVYTLYEEKNGICSERPKAIYAAVKSWIHARSHISCISLRSRGNKDQSGLSYPLHYRETLSSPSAGLAQSTNFGLLVDFG